MNLLLLFNDSLLTFYFVKLNLRTYLSNKLSRKSFIFLTNLHLMYKIGIMLMGKPTKTPKKVKEIIIEVEPKTKINDILTYLVDLKRI